MGQESAHEELLAHFGDLLNALKPKMETSHTHDKLKLTLEFDSNNIDNLTMRKLATLVADQVT